MYLKHREDLNSGFYTLPRRPGGKSPGTGDRRSVPASPARTECIPAPEKTGRRPGVKVQTAPRAAQDWFFSQSGQETLHGSSRRFTTVPARPSWSSDVTVDASLCASSRLLCRATWSSRSNRRSFPSLRILTFW